jgi:serine/threonine protein kinase
MEKDSLTIVARIAEISRPEFVHENILKCYGYADDGLNTIYYIHEEFGLEFSDTFVHDYSVHQLYEFGRQIKNGLQFLHDRDIVHGFPALQNVYINDSLGQVKLGKIGILSAIMHASEAHRSDETSSSGGSFLRNVKYPELNDLLTGWFSQKRVRMLHEYPEEKLQETWDRSVTVIIIIDLILSPA